MRRFDHARGIDRRDRAVEDVHRERDEVHERGRARVLDRVERAEQQLERRERQEADGERREDGRDEVAARGSRRSVLEQHAHDRSREDEVGERRGEHDGAGSAEAAREEVPEPLDVSGRPPRRERGQERGEDRNGEDRVGEREEHERRGVRGVAALRAGREDEDDELAGLVREDVDEHPSRERRDLPHRRVEAEARLEEKILAQGEAQDYLLVQVNSPTKHAIILGYVHRLEEFSRGLIEFSGAQPVEHMLRAFRHAHEVLSKQAA